MHLRSLSSAKNLIKILIFLVVIINFTSITYFKFESGSSGLLREAIFRDEQIISDALAPRNSNGNNDNVTPSQQKQQKQQPDTSSSNISVSVIIPVYMVEKYIEKCIVSLLTQTLGNKMEFIFVDDFGTDGSMELVEKYARVDPRIRIVRNAAHIGPGPSRNAGIAAAVGQYLGFVDPDDWIGQTFYETLYNASQSREGGFDVVKGTMVETSETGRYKMSWLNKKIERQIAENRSIYVFELFTFQHQTGLFRRSLVETNAGLVKYGSTYSGEDITFLFTFGFFAKSILCVDEARYYYLVRDTSLSNRVTYRLLKDDLASINARIDFVEERGFSMDEFPIYKKRCVKMAKKRLGQLSSVKKDIDEAEFEALRKYALDTLDRLKRD